MARGRFFRGDFSAGIIDRNFEARTDAKIRYQGVSDIWNMMVHPQGGVRTLNNLRSRDITGIEDGYILLATDRLYFDDSDIRTIRYYQHTDGSVGQLRIRGEDSNEDTIIPIIPLPNTGKASQISAIAFGKVIWVFSPLFSPVRIPVSTTDGITTFGENTGFKANFGTLIGDNIDSNISYNNHPASASSQILTLGGLLNRNAYLIISLDGIPSAKISLNTPFTDSVPVNNNGDTQHTPDIFTRHIRIALLEIPAIRESNIRVYYHTPESDPDDYSVGYTNGALTTTSDAINTFFDNSSSSTPYPDALPGLADKRIRIDIQAPGEVSTMQVELIDNRGSGARVEITSLIRGRDKSVPPLWEFEQPNILITKGPEIAAIFQNRMYVADSENNTGNIIASSIDIFTNFSVGGGLGRSIIGNDSSPLTAEINSRGTPIINHYVVGRTLFVFSSLGIWAVNTQGAITPSTISVYKVSERVADRNIKPIEISGRIFFLEEGRPNLRMIEYNERIDNFEVRSVSQTFTQQLKGKGADAKPTAMCLYREDEADYLAITFSGTEIQSALMVLIQPEDDLFAPSRIGLGAETINHAYCDEENQTLIFTTPTRELILGGTDGDEVMDMQNSDSGVSLSAWVELLPMAIQPEERQVISGLVVGIDDLTIYFTNATGLYFGYRDDNGVGSEFRDAVLEYWEPYKNGTAGNAPYTGSVLLPKLKSNERNIRVIIGVKDPNATLYLSGVEIEASWN